MRYSRRRGGCNARAAVEIAPETGELALRGACAFTGVSGRRLRLQWGASRDAIKIWQDGKLRDLDSALNRASYASIGDEKLIEQSWKGDGTLRVAAGGYSFTCTVTRTGHATF